MVIAWSQATRGRWKWAELAFSWRFASWALPTRTPVVVLDPVSVFLAKFAADQFWSEHCYALFKDLKISFAINSTNVLADLVPTNRFALGV
ncbi:hypothetical protein AN456_20160 [Pseudomonas aeruginosa]|nr:hypothetical protein AN455_19255 [Pseudomonas aeruginosa]KRV00133.1 hypothetical protein AN456_20160 [Pseudomonas aeruginosa]